MRLILRLGERLRRAGIRVKCRDSNVRTGSRRRCWARWRGEDARAGWAGIAAAAGYYDQAHLIAEFRATAGGDVAAVGWRDAGAAAIR